MITTSVMQLQIERLIRKLNHLPHLEKDLPEKIDHAITYVNGIISTLSQYYPPLERCGSTLVTGVFTPTDCIIHWIGDSCAMLYREGSLIPLTTLHEDRASPYLTNYIGKEKIAIHRKRIPTKEDDVFVFFSDGLGDTVSHQEIKNVCATSPFDNLLEALVHHAHHPEVMAKLYSEEHHLSVTEAKTKLAGNDDISIVIARGKTYEQPR